jgi:hypothetical protein
MQSRNWVWNPRDVENTAKNGEGQPVISPLDKYIFLSWA